MKKLPKGVCSLIDPIYCQEFLVIITPTYKKFKKLVKDVINYDIEEDDNGCTGQFTAINDKQKGSLGIIWASDKHSNLIHEIFHATSWVLRNRDLYLDSEGSDEAYAYYIAYLYREITERL